MDNVLDWFITRVASGDARSVLHLSTDMLKLSTANKELKGIWKQFRAAYPERYDDVRRQIVAERYKHTKQYRYMYDDGRHVYSELERLNLLQVTDLCDRDWYVTHMDPSFARLALKDTGALVGASKEWCEKHFGDSDLGLCVLVEAGVHNVHVKGNTVAQDAQKLCMELEDPALYRWDIVKAAGLFKREIGREWLARRFYYEGEEPETLFEALRLSNLLTGECGIEWYRKYLSGDFLTEAIRVSGLSQNDRNI